MSAHRRCRIQIDLVEIIKPADSGVILTDAGVIHDHAAHAPHRRIEGIVPAAIAPGNDEVRSMRVANKRATGDRQNFCVLKCSHDPLVPQGGYYGSAATGSTASRLPTIIAERKSVKPPFHSGLAAINVSLGSEVRRTRPSFRPSDHADYPRKRRGALAGCGTALCQAAYFSLSASSTAAMRWGSAASGGMPARSTCKSWLTLLLRVPQPRFSASVSSS